MKPDLNDKLILWHQVEVKKQGYIELTNIDAHLFETQVNFVQNIPNSLPTTVKKKGSSNWTRDWYRRPWKVFFKIRNKDHSHTIKKILELISHLKKEKDALATMRSSLAKFKSYLEMNGGPPITESLSDQIAALELEFTSQPVPSITTEYIPPAKTCIWDLPMNITTTIVLVLATTTHISYKSAVQNRLVTTDQSKSNQIQSAETTISPQHNLLPVKWWSPAIPMRTCFPSALK